MKDVARMIRKHFDGIVAWTQTLLLRTNSSFLDRSGWQAEITKMTNVFGAPIAPEDANAIADYLAKNYGIGG